MVVQIYWTHVRPVRPPAGAPGNAVSNVALTNTSSHFGVYFAIHLSIFKLYLSVDYMYKQFKQQMS